VSRQGTAPRGQAMVEMSLGLLVFITILLFGIHFAEIGMIKLRVQQAAASALWDTSGLRAHRLDTGEFYGPDQIRDPQGRTPGDRATAFYEDFDRLSAGGSQQLVQVMTRGSQLAVTCTPENVSPLSPTAAAQRLREGYPQGVDGMACGAQARVEIWGMPQTFMEGGNGFFQVPHVSRPQFQVCAFGRAVGNTCPGVVRLALSDWGLAGSNPAFGRELEECDGDCTFGTAGNQAYKKTVERIYEAYNVSLRNQGGSIEAFMQELFTQTPAAPELADVPVNELDFRMVFIGEDGRDGNPPFHFTTREQNNFQAINHSWASSPYAGAYRTAHTERGQCFLGTTCSRSVFAKGGW
jgi:hypothetical protein